MQNFLKTPSELAEEQRKFYKNHPYPVPGYEWGITGPVRCHVHGLPSIVSSNKIPDEQPLTDN